MIFFVSLNIFLIFLYIFFLSLFFYHPPLWLEITNIRYSEENLNFIFGYFAGSLFLIFFTLIFLFLYFFFKKNNLKKIFKLLPLIFSLIYIILTLFFFLIIKKENKNNQFVSLNNLEKKYNKIILKNLKEGDFGDDVLILQYILSKEFKDYPKNLYTSYFGKITKEFLLRFQEKNNLKKTGFLDSNTIEKINNLYGKNTRNYYLQQLKSYLSNNNNNINNNLRNKENEEWGVAKQISEKTWTMKVGLDQRMATAQEIFEALNNYRERHGRSRLNWDERLANFALERAKYFTQIGGLDEHRGFEGYVGDIENLKKLGFWRLGENSSFGYRLEGVHLIEWVFAGDEPHNKNQLDPEWTHVGIGVDGYQVDIIFGADQI